MDYFAPFTYFFKDKDWLKKFLIASLLSYTLIGAAPVLGWTLEIVRRVGQGQELLVPELSDWRTFWKLGGKFSLINAVWLLPVLLATILLYIPLIFSRSIRPEMTMAVFGGTLGCVVLFLLVYSILYLFLVPSMMILLVETGSIWKAIDPVGLWRVARRHFSGHLMTFLIVGVGLLNLMVLIAPFTLFLFLPPMLVYTLLVNAHFAGQLERLKYNGV